jgi:[acyl-carrier-protein] S-malonyltransferase
MPGQGAQYRGMGLGLYRDLPSFAAIIDEVFRVMGPAGDELRSDWLAADPTLPVDDVRRSQPLLFAIDYALGRLLMNMGSRPAALLGHSIGEIAAATLAGIFSLDSAVSVIQHRVGQLAAGPFGGMLAVAASPEELEPYLGEGVDIGAINAPRQTVIAGAGESLRAASDVLREAGFTCAPVFSRTPFHSAVLQPMVEAARPLLASLTLRPPEIAVVSGYTARGLTGAEATDPMYWARHPVDPVLFWPALETLLRVEPCLLIECGPGVGLITLARRHPDVRSGRCQVLPLIGSAAAGPGGEAQCFATAAAKLGLPVP